MATRSLLRLSVGMLLVCLAAAPLGAQTTSGHSLYNGQMRPGEIGAWQLKRGTPLAGYFQPVEVLAPEGVEIGLAADGAFTPTRPAPVIVGMQIAPVYRLRVTNIPNEQGREVYPTIEVIDRIYPPVGQEARFPIPIELTIEDLRLALDGNYITRVIYLEDPERALPMVERSGHPSWFDAGPGTDPLLQADQLGRPVAILRMGGRLPVDGEQLDQAFVGPCPPWILYGRTASDAGDASGIEPEMLMSPEPAVSQPIPTIAPPPPLPPSSRAPASGSPHRGGVTR